MSAHTYTSPLAVANRTTCRWGSFASFSPWAWVVTLFIVNPAVPSVTSACSVLSTGGPPAHPARTAASRRQTVPQMLTIGCMSFLSRSGDGDHVAARTALGVHQDLLVRRRRAIADGDAAGAARDGCLRPEIDPAAAELVDRVAVRVQLADEDVGPLHAGGDVAAR